MENNVSEAELTALTRWAFDEMDIRRRCYTAHIFGFVIIYLYFWIVQLEGSVAA